MAAKRKPNSSDRLLKVQTAAYFDKPQYQALKALSRRTDKPMQEFIREGVDLILAKHKKVKKA